MKLNKRNTRSVKSAQLKKTPKRRQICRYVVFIVNFEQTSDYPKN